MGEKVRPALGEVESRTTNAVAEGRVAVSRKYHPYCRPRNVRWGSRGPRGGREGDIDGEQLHEWCVSAGGWPLQVI